MDVPHIDQPTVLVIAGPTAAGKSSLASKWAEATDGVVINADSMQVYEGLPILTAQPSAAEQARIPHQLYGYLSPLEASDVAKWRLAALREIEETLANGQQPIVVGGTGLYLKALLVGLAPIPDVPEEVQQAVLQEPEPYRALQEIDPVMAKKLYPADQQRVRRALAVMRATGQSLAHWQQQPGEALPYPHQLTKILPDRNELYAKINTRLEQMIEQGAIAEVKALLKLSLPAHYPAMKILGVPELAAYARGECSLAEAVALAQQQTRRYAKRQYTWLRHQL